MDGGLAWIIHEIVQDATLRQTEVTEVIRQHQRCSPFRVQFNMEPAIQKSKPKRRSTCDSRVERKRELDRLAQRATRERTKNRIAFLEQKLASLESNDRSSEIVNLTKIIENLRNDNTRLQSAMLKMKLTINDALDGIVENATLDSQEDSQATAFKDCGCPLDSKCHCGTNGMQPEQASSTESDTPRHNSVHTVDSEPIINIPQEPMRSSVPDGIPVPAEMTTAMTGLEAFFGVDAVPSMNPVYEIPNWDFPQWQQATPSPFDFRMPVPENSLALAKDIDKWQVSNGAFINCMDSVKKKVATNQTLDLHVPFKAAIWGWDSIGPEVNHPVWSALRRVDQKVFGTWTSVAQRIALMYVCQTLLQYRENPTRENLQRVPVWFRPRPAQEKIQHPAVVDFLIWPGLRDRLVFEHEKYNTTGDFSAAFVNNFNFYWPYTEREIFSFNEAMNTYEVSKVFLEYAYDFKNWTMRSEFFKKFPEMQHDIPEFGVEGFNTNIWAS